MRPGTKVVVTQDCQDEDMHATGIVVRGEVGHVLAVYGTKFVRVAFEGRQATLPSRHVRPLDAARIEGEQL